MRRSLTDAERTLANIIKREQERVKSSFVFDRRIGLIEIARSVDQYIVSQMMNDKFSETAESVGHLIGYGLHKALDLFLDDFSNSEGAPLFRSIPDSQVWADSVLQHCGRIGYCEHILEMCRVGLAKLHQKDVGVFNVELSALDPIGVETREREYYTWYQERERSKQGEHFAALEARRHRIWRAMSRRVSPWRQYFIQYTTSPEIDEFYNYESALHIHRMIGGDSFSGSTTFGDIRFELYQQAIITLVGWGIKHLGFSIELLKKSVNLDPRNLQTITMSVDSEANYLALALNIEPSIARNIISMLTLSYRNKRTHLATAGNLITPIYVEIGKGQLLRPLWGPLSNPFLFMLDEIRRNHPADWDRGVADHESTLRNELYGYFKEDQFHKLTRPIKLKRDGKLLTDIDAFIFDHNTGTAGVFQLKWQDLFGSSLQKRKSQKGNLVTEGNKWISRVLEWFEFTSLKDISETFALSIKDVQLIRTWRIFVIGRHSANFSGPQYVDQRAAWGHAIHLNNPTSRQ